MEVRDIEIFLTLAKELHFGRAAVRLHLTQARISQVIGRQKRQLGGLLFDRSNRRRIRLTPLGRQLRTDLLPVYADLRDSLERARMASRGKTARLRVGMMPFNVIELHHYWKTFQARRPQWELQVRRAPYVDPFGRLREGEMDVFITWLPVDEPDLTVGPVLFHDRRVLAVSAVHELADRLVVPVEALADFGHAMAPEMPDYWEDGYWCGAGTPRTTAFGPWPRPSATWASCGSEATGPRPGPAGHRRVTRAPVRALLRVTGAEQDRTGREHHGHRSAQRPGVGPPTQFVRLPVGLLGRPGHCAVPRPCPTGDRGTTARTARQPGTTSASRRAGGGAAGIGRLTAEPKGRPDGRAPSGGRQPAAGPRRAERPGHGGQPNGARHCIRDATHSGQATTHQRQPGQPGEPVGRLEVPPLKSRPVAGCHNDAHPQVGEQVSGWAHLSAAGR
ncbi:LysR family transcriptional regulator [Streptomyces sp. NPDC051452]|uniref:LysR family transcriptional regulator n=1 Tax=Streptomyces sp. NPDC051452 TaxID=3365654 RepID=UPI003796B4F5